MATTSRRPRRTQTWPTADGGLSDRSACVDRLPRRHGHRESIILAINERTQCFDARHINGARPASRYRIERGVGSRTVRAGSVSPSLP